jgi:hypothetical protein
MTKTKQKKQLLMNTNECQISNTKPETLWVEMEIKDKRGKETLLSSVIPALRKRYAAFVVKPYALRKLRAAQPKQDKPKMCYWNEYDRCDKQAYISFCLKHWRDEKAEVANDEIRTIMFTYESRLKECEVKARAEGIAQGRKLQEAEDRADCQKCVWNKSIKKEAQKQVKA